MLSGCKIWDLRILSVKKWQIWGILTVFWIVKVKSLLHLALTRPSVAVITIKSLTDASAHVDSTDQKIYNFGVKNEWFVLALVHLPVHPSGVYLNRSSLSTRFVSRPTLNKDFKWFHSSTRSWTKDNRVTFHFSTKKIKKEDSSTYQLDIPSDKQHFLFRRLASTERK